MSLKGPLQGKIRFACSYLASGVALFVLSATFFLCKPFFHSTLIIPQHGFIGGTMYYIRNLIQLLIKTKPVQLLVPEHEKEQYSEAYSKQVAGIRSFKDEFDHPEVYFDKAHSLYKYYRLRIVQQRVCILRHAIATRSNRLLVSATHPGRFSFAFLFPGRMSYILHTLPWIDLDIGNKNTIASGLSKPGKSIIAVSAYLKGEIIRYWGLSSLESKIHVIRNFYEPLNKVHPQRKEVIGILTLGNLIPDKNPKLWIDMARELSKKHRNIAVEWVWAGQGPMYEELKSLCANEENIHFAGWVDDVDKLYAGSAIYLQPSMAESAGIGIIGAMAHGIPAVVSDKGGTTESVEHGITGYLCNPGERDRYISYIEKLILNPEIRERLGSKARERFEKMFTKSLWEERISGLLNQCL
ncbi:MAG: hypothetical protein CSA96_05260 [Bacteroidetes bacterium]|nr:MAG: hypothetical protein CSA96_05260 [Bacteroidota bacterium]